MSRWTSCTSTIVRLGRAAATGGWGFFMPTLDSGKPVSRPPFDAAASMPLETDISCASASALLG